MQAEASLRERQVRGAAKAGSDVTFISLTASQSRKPVYVLRLAKAGLFSRWPCIIFARPIIESEWGSLCGSVKCPGLGLLGTGLQSNWGN